MGFDRLERDYQRVFDELTWDEFPIHFAGAALFLVNAGAADVTVRFYDSDDGTTWNVLTFSDLTAAGLITATVVGHSYKAVLLTTAREYFRITVTDDSEAGLYVHLVQIMPRNTEVTAYS